MITDYTYLGGVASDVGTFLHHFMAAAKVAAFFVRDGIAQYGTAHIANFLAGRLTDKTDGRLWFGNFVVSKIAQE